MNSLPRGDCAEAVAAAALAGSAAAAGHRACPPGVVAVVAPESAEPAREPAKQRILKGPAWYANARYFRLRPSSAMRQLMLSSPSTTPALALSIAAADDRPEVLKACAASAACPPCLLAVLAHHADWATRRTAAASEACPPSMLEQLTRDDRHEVRLEAAANPATPARAMRRLAQRLPPPTVWHLETLLALASNRACPPDVLERLSHSGDRKLLSRVMHHPACPTPILERFVSVAPWPAARDFAESILATRSAA